MKIVERYIRSKTKNASECEDIIFFSDDFAAIIDGTTSKSQEKYNSISPGKTCAQIIYNALISLPKKASASTAICYLSKAVYYFYQRMEIVKRVKSTPSERISASVIVYSNYKNEIWMVGDCQCLVNEIHYSNKRIIDEMLANIRSLYIQTEFKLGKSFNSIQKNDVGRQYILPLLERQSLFQNSSKKDEYSFGIIDGFKVPKDEIKVIKLHKNSTVILASDGYPKLFPTLIQSEEYLIEVISKDPLFYQQYKSTKGLKKGNNSFDDRAYLKINCA